jgi:hypothetical protein
MWPNGRGEAAQKEPIKRKYYTKYEWKDRYDQTLCDDIVIT